PRWPTRANGNPLAGATITYSGGTTTTDANGDYTLASGPAGATITIGGMNFNGATEVTFNGILADSFTVDSATQIRVVVPNGATTGKIGVTTAAGVVSSAANFVITAPATYYPI